MIFFRRASKKKRQHEGWRQISNFRSQSVTVENFEAASGNQREHIDTTETQVNIRRNHLVGDQAGIVTGRINGILRYKNRTAVLSRTIRNRERQDLISAYQRPRHAAVEAVDKTGRVADIGIAKHPCLFHGPTDFAAAGKL